MVFYYANSKKHEDDQSILLYGRRVSDNAVYNFFINNFFPYFAVPADEENMLKIIDLEKKKVIIKHLLFDDEEGTKTYHDQHGNPLVVVFTATTKAHTAARGEFERTFQDDVRYERVFRLTKNIYGFFAIPEIEAVLKMKPVHVSHRGHEVDVPYYNIPHEQVYGF
jgi:hypothetical protein